MFEGFKRWWRTHFEGCPFRGAECSAFCDPWKLKDSPEGLDYCGIYRGLMKQEVH